MLIPYHQVSSIQKQGVAQESCIALLHPVLKPLPADIVHLIDGADVDDTATAVNFAANVVEDFEIPRSDLKVSIECDRQVEYHAQ